MKSSVRAETASRILGIPAQELRIGIQRGRFKFGEEHKNPGCKRRYYSIYLYKASEELGIPIQVLEERWDRIYGNLEENHAKI